MSVFRRLSEIKQPKLIKPELIDSSEDDEMGFFLIQTGKGKVIKVTGRLDAHTAPTLEEHLNRHLIENEKKIVFDFRGLDFISSAGLRVCVKAHQKSDLTLIMPKTTDNPIYKVFDMSGISLTLKIEESIDSAL